MTDNPPLMPIGPYRGFTLAAVPDHHLYFLIERGTLRKPHLDAVVQELERRANQRRLLAIAAAGPRRSGIRI